MATSTTYYVSKKNKLKYLEGQNIQHAISSGKAKYCIEVFGNNNKEVAKGIKKLVEDQGLEGAFYSIKVSTKDESIFLPASDAVLNGAFRKMGWPVGEWSKSAVKLMEIKLPGHLETVMATMAKEPLTEEEKEAMRKCSKELW